jgi:hypothetical protein
MNLVSAKKNYPKITPPFGSEERGGVEIVRHTIQILSKSLPKREFLAPDTPPYEMFISRPAVGVFRLRHPSMDEEVGGGQKRCQPG